MSAPFRRPRVRLLALAITVSLLPAACSTDSTRPRTPHTFVSSPGSPSASPRSPSESPSPSPVRSPSPSAHSAVSALQRVQEACPSVLSWDDFHRSDRSLHRDRLPTGQRYYASGPDAQRISHNQYVSDVAANTPDLLYVWLHRTPVALAARWVFVRDQTMRENAVIGVAPRHAVIGHRHLLGFGIGSVQLSIYPDHMWFFYITNANYSLQYHTVAMMQFNSALHQDGHTVYHMAMAFHPTTSSVVIEYPGGQRTFRNPAFNQLWGRLFGIQVRRPHATDGNVRFVTAGSASRRCSTSSLLGPQRVHH